MSDPVSDCGVRSPTLFNLPGLGYEPRQTVGLYEWPPDGLTTKHRVNDALAAQMKKAAKCAAFCDIDYNLLK
ncbi:Uncharacterised protein [Klebsiella pneumoniae]|nr:Uncharacterised protein [Klebsiella pneumoniae]